MKINHKDLKRLYRNYLDDIQPISRANCPSPKDILDCLRNKYSKKKKNLILEHIVQCSYCYEEFKFVQETVRAEEKFIIDLQGLCPEKKQRRKNKFYLQAISFRPVWIYGLILITGAVLVSLLVRNISEEQKYRGNETHAVTLISPTAKTEQKAQLEFKWKDVHKSEYFILEIFDETLYPVWTSDRIKENQVILSKETTDILSKQKPYYWMVTAHLSDGKTIESRLQGFFVSD